MLSIGALASASQGASYYERDGYYARDDPDHRAASAWAGTGAAELGLEGEVDAGVFRSVLEGKVPDGSDTRLGRRGKDGEIAHRPGRDLTFSAPKSVSLAALVGGDGRIVDAHDRAVKATLAWIEGKAAETRMRDPETGRMVRAGGQKIVAATFRHDTSRNLDPQLHTHAVLANMVKGGDGKWRSMANEGLYERQKLIGMLYRNELARGLARLGYDIEKTHADGRFEIGGVSRAVVEAFSTRRAEIEAAMAERGLGESADSPRLAERAALMTREAKRDIDRDELRGVWEGQAADLGFDAKALVAEAAAKGAEPAKEGPEPGTERGTRTDGLSAVEPQGAGVASAGAPIAGSPAAEGRPAAQAAAWAMAHLSEREAVFARADLLAAALAHAPGTVSIAEAEREVGALEKAGALHAVSLPGAEDSLATQKTVGEERETVALMRLGQRQGRAPMRGWQVQGHLNKGPLTAGQKDAVKLILSAKDRVVGVQGYAGTGKTTMLDRARTLAQKKGWRVAGLAPSASAVQTLGTEAGIESETLQRFLARNAGVAEGRLTNKGAREMRAAFAKTILVVDEGSLASTVQARDLLRIANALRIPRVVLVGDAKQLDAVDAGKPFAQLQGAGLKTATMDEIMRQRDPALKEAVEASLKGDIARAFEKLGANVAEVKADNIAGAVAARWLKLSPEQRERTGVMAPSHALRQAINGHIRERLAREGGIHGPAMETERLVSKGYTNAERALAGNYAAGDVVAFHRPYKRIGVEKGDERSVMGCGPQGPGGAARRRQGRHRRLETGRDRRALRRRRGLPGRGDRAARRGPHPLDPQRRVLEARQQPHRRGRRGRERAGDFPSGRRAEARAQRKRSAASPSRPCLGLDRACVPGPHGRQRDCGDGGASPASDDQKSFYVEISRARDRRNWLRTMPPSFGPSSRPSRRAHRGARSSRSGSGEGSGRRIGHAEERQPGRRRAHVAERGPEAGIGYGTNPRAARRSRPRTIGSRRRDRQGILAAAGQAGRSSLSKELYWQRDPCDFGRRKRGIFGGFCRMQRVQAGEVDQERGQEVGPVDPADDLRSDVTRHVADARPHGCRAHFGPEPEWALSRAQQAATVGHSDGDSLLSLYFSPVVQPELPGFFDGCKYGNAGCLK